MNSVLFLCTGNYYRSRFAEMLFNHLATKAQLDWRAASRGLRAYLAGPGLMSEYTEARAKQLGIDCSPYQRAAQQCELCDLGNADLVIALKEAEHRAMLADHFEGWQDRATYWHVHDLDAAVPEQALSEIEQLVAQLVKDLSSRQDLAA